jgi:CheY-like chemotaxis protein/anti-sigma regulatory factor (Ser/Thr protein kinase)
MDNIQPAGRILAVDDEPFDLMLIERYLSRANYQVTRATTGAQAWRMLQDANQELPEAILLDRQMPEMNGIEFLEKFTADPRLHEIPVIMQTGLADPAQIAYGIACGARYYLAKPFTSELLVAMVQAVVRDYREMRGLRSAATQFDSVRQLLIAAQFELRTLDDARGLAAHIAQYFPRPSRVVSGIVEILVNAIEHGNLGLTYAEKSALLKTAAWEDEIERRLELPAYRDKRVRVDLRLLENGTALTVTDEGAGFDWRPFLEIQPERVFDLHGRGIAMSRLLSFDRVEYRGSGNEVELTVFTQRDADGGEDALPSIGNAVRDAA